MGTAPPIAVGTRPSQAGRTLGMTSKLVPAAIARPAEIFQCLSPAMAATYRFF
jgi:hypothetical protein